MPKSQAEYVPDVADVWYRANAVLWMQDQGWDSRIIDSVMYRDTPTIDTVERLVGRYGEKKAYDLIKRITE